jgi:RHS repeat-associated protein
MITIGHLRRLSHALAFTPWAVAVSVPAMGAAGVSSGTMPGAFNVGPSGDAQYTISIEVPPGVQGMEPTLGLAYGSFTGNGPVGVGWSLTGLSSITRCKAVPYADGFRGTIRFDGRDRLCLDGQRLVDTAGTYGRPGSLYHTELETWRLVAAGSSACGSAPCSFTVTSKGGVRWLYGTSPDSRVLAADGVNVRTWALAQVVDLHGNSIAFSYTGNPLGLQPAPKDFAYYLSAIDYTSNGGLAANRRVSFAYEARPDVDTELVGGTAIVTRARLAAITTSVQARPVLTYGLAYETSETTGRSLVTRVQACAGGRGATTCLTPTVLHWQGADQLEVGATNLPSPLPAGYAQLFPVDTNGDSRGDLVYTWNTPGLVNVLVYRSTGSDLVACPQPMPIGDTGTPLLPLDINGDGRADLLQPATNQGTQTFYWYLADPDGCTWTGGGPLQTTLPTAPTVVWPMDMNGDGRGDLVQGWVAGGLLTLSSLVSDGNGFVPGGTQTLTLGPNFQLLPGDVNGDGLVDLVQAWTAAGGGLTLTAYLSDGVRFDAGTDSALGGSERGEFLQVDVNEDGLTDVVQAWPDQQSLMHLTTWIADGTGRFRAGGDVATGRGTTGTIDVWPLDLAGDSGTDLVQIWNDAGRLSLVMYRRSGKGGTGYDSGTVAATPLASGQTNATWAMDVDGDSRMELVQAWSPAGQGTLTVTRYAVTGPAADLVDAITDGLAGQTAIAYLTMADPRVYLPATPTYPAVPAMAYEYREAPAQAPYQVLSGGKAQLVWRWTQQSAPGVTSGAYRYPHERQYGGAAIDTTGHGWLGFATVSDTNLANGRRTTTAYNQTFPLTGTPSAVTHSCVAAAGPLGDPLCTSGQPVTLNVTATAYTPVQVAHSASSMARVWSVQQKSARHDTYSYGVYAFSLGTTQQYDAYGNVTLRSNLGYVDLQGGDRSPDDDVYTCTSYSNQVTPTGWRLGYPTAVKVSSSPACSATAPFGAGDLSLETIAYTQAMQVAAQGAWDSTNAVFLTTSYTYDAFGNALSRTEPGDRLTAYTYETTFQTYPLTQTTPANAAGRRLSSTYGHDPRFGTLVAISDQNGLVTVTCVDGFGGHTATQTPIPAFAGSAPDPNCVPAQVTGPAAQFAAAPVITLESQSLGADSAGQVYVETTKLQSWGAGKARDLRWHRVYYDGLGRGFQEVDEGPSASGNVVVCRAFDPVDVVVRESLPYFFAASEDDCTARSGDPRRWVTTSLDAYGRLTRAVRPAGPTGGETSTTTVSYTGGDTETFTYAAGDAYALTKSHRYRYYDSQRKLAQSVFVSDGGATSSFAYDRIGRLVSATDPPTPSNPQGVANTIAYDSLDRRTSVGNPDQNTSGGTATSWTYDPATGFATASTDASGRTFQSAYDGLGRLTQTMEADGTVTTFAYDDPAVANGQGRLCHVSARSASNAPLYRYDFTYDAVDQPASRTVTLGQGPGPYTTATQLDPLERVSRLVYPDQSVLVNTYAFGNLAQSTLGTQAVATYADFTPSGEAQRVLFGNGVAAASSFAPTGEPVAQKVVDATGRVLLDRTLGWNHLGQVATSADNLKAGVDFSQAYSYTAGRLTGATAAQLYPPQAYGYDASGNLILQADVQYAYTAHRLTGGTRSGAPVVKAGYDRNGNLDSKVAGADQWTYAYDTLNRLVAVTRNGAKVLSVPLYDHLGGRLLRVDGDGTTSVYADPTYVVTELPGTYAVATRYVPGPDGVVAGITSVLSGTPPAGQGGYPGVGALYHHDDYLGSTSLTTTAQGILGSTFAYAPYGAIAATGTSGPDDVRQKFAGQELDEPSSLYYFGARYYDPSLGRFITPDSDLAAELTAVDALNRFAYALNNPTSFVDPTGHNTDAILGALIGASEILAGIAVDVLSGGALEPLGGALMGGGMAALDYSLSHTGDFAWKQYGIETGIGAAMGLFTGGFGGEAAGAARAGEQLAEREVANATRLEAREALGEVGGAELRTGERAARQPESELGEESSDAAMDVAQCVVSAASFASGTSVLTEDGPRAVETIRPGERVLAQDGETGEQGLYAVVEASASPQSGLLRVTAAGARLDAAPGQLFWVSGRGWTPADALRPGDPLVDAEGRRHAVESVAGLDEPATVIAIEVETAHTFYASDGGLLVHNPNKNKKPSCRDVAMGRTPGKNARPGREVFERWEAKGKARVTKTGEKQVKVYTSKGAKHRTWVKLDEKIHMGHREDAVKWWNKEGYKYGARAKQVRKFMLNSKKYRFEWGPLNSSNGASLQVFYRMPKGWTKVWPPQ